MRIHFIGIGGVGMGRLAGILKAAGHAVSGSDNPVYEPMQSYLANIGIAPSSYSPANISEDLDVVVVGAAEREDNVEVRQCKRLNLSLVSLPEALQKHVVGE